MKKGYFSVGTAALLSLGLFTSTYAADACNDAMGHVGTEHKVQVSSSGGNNQYQGLGKISGTSWGFEEWYEAGNNSMSYWDNGTFKASWSGTNDYLARVGFQYNGGIDHSTKHFAVDYKYTKSGTAQYGYIGVYGWTTNPQVEYYIVDDWYSQPSENYIGEKFGEITVDGATYTIHAFLRVNQPSKTGYSTFLQIFSVRKTARQCGHIDISAHFNKWTEIFKGQNKNLRATSCQQGQACENYTLKFGKITEVMLMNEAGGNASGSVDYTYFNMVDNAEGSTVTSSASTNPTSSASSTLESVGTVPGTIEMEDFQDKSGSFEANGGSLGNIEPGDWAEYTVDVTYAGTYTFDLSAARQDDQGRTTSIDLVIDGTNVGSISGILTDGWDDYKSYTGVTTRLTAGKHTLRVEFTDGYVNVDKIVFTEKDVDKGSKYEPPTSSASAPTSSGSVAPASNGSTPASNSSGKNDKATAAIGNIHMSLSTMDMQVFDIQGRNLGFVRVDAGASLEESLFAKFHKSGIYLVKQGSLLTKVRVTR